MITLNNIEVFCAKCASFNLRFRDDELMQEYAGTKETMVECERCNSFFSKEFIEENINDFTEPEKRFEIIDSRAKMYDRYRKFDEGEKDEKKIERKQDLYRQTEIQ
jgi:hypothetical protein